MRLNEGLKSGKVERKLFRVLRTDGAVHSMPHYRIVKKSV